jgi:hypothetical protein
VVAQIGIGRKGGISAPRQGLIPQSQPRCRWLQVSVLAHHRQRVTTASKRYVELSGFEAFRAQDDAVIVFESLDQQRSGDDALFRGSAGDAYAVAESGQGVGDSHLAAGSSYLERSERVPPRLAAIEPPALYSPDSLQRFKYPCGRGVRQQLSQAVQR